MQQVKVQEATAQLPSLIDAAMRGEVVRLVPIKRTKQPRRAGSAKGLIRIASDFDAPLDDFREYTT